MIRIFFTICPDFIRILSGLNPDEFLIFKHLDFESSGFFHPDFMSPDFICPDFVELPYICYGSCPGHNPKTT